MCITQQIFFVRTILFWELMLFFHIHKCLMQKIFFKGSILDQLNTEVLFCAYAITEILYTSLWLTDIT